MLKFLDENKITIAVLLCVISLIFIAFGHKYRDSVQKVLQKDFIKLPATNIDWWSISHLILYGILGFIIPNQHFTFFLLGSGFEIVEDMLSSNETTQLDNCNTPDKNEKIMCKMSIDNDYWYAKWDDIFINLLGYTVGSSARCTFF